MIEPRHDRTAPVGWWALFWATKGWFAMIAAVVLLVFTAVSVSSYRKAQEFATQGVWVSAEITRKRTRRHGDDTDYLVSFAYEVDGKAYARERDTGNRFYHAHDAGEVVQIKVLPHRPQAFEYREGQTQTSAVLMQVMGGLAGLLGCFSLWQSGSKANSGTLARRYGRRTVATIESFTEIKNSGAPTGRGYMVFRTSDGLRGESLNNDIRKLRALGAGTSIVVFVRGKDVWWEGDVGPRPERQSDMPRVPRDL